VHAIPLLHFKKQARVCVFQEEEEEEEEAEENKRNGC